MTSVYPKSLDDAAVDANDDDDYYPPSIDGMGMRGTGTLAEWQSLKISCIARVT